MTTTASASTSKANEDLHDIARTAGRNLRRYLDQNWQDEDAVKTVAAVIEKNPLSSALVALGVGAFIGFFVSKR